jgi:tetratricopeptide (TPR) repeat protein
VQSHFSSQTLAEIFRDLYLGERTGVLELDRDGAQKRIWFSRGLIHYAESYEDFEKLGRRLVQDKLLSAGALQEAESGRTTGVSLAQGLVNRGLIAREPLGNAIKAIIESVVRSVFRWEGGAARFKDESEGEPVFDTDVLMTFEVILQGIFTMTDFDPIGEAMHGLDNQIRLRSPAPLPVERLTLSASHGFILSRVDGTCAGAEVLSVLPQHEEALALRFLFGLLVMGVLEYNPSLGDGPFRVANILRDHADRRALERMQEQTVRQAYAQMRTQNPYEVLGVTPSTGREAIEQAYEEAKGLFSRDRLLPSVRDQFRSELAVIESRLIEAYLRLTQADTVGAVRNAPIPQGLDENSAVDSLLVRVEMDKTRSKVALEESQKVAKSYFNKATKAQRDGDFHNAIQYGKLAISYDPEDAKLVYLLAECQVRNPGPRWQHQAEQNFTKATELDPWNAVYWISLGRFYKKRGLKLRARKQFEEALKLVPEHPEAESELAALGS